MDLKTVSEKPEQILGLVNSVNYLFPGNNSKISFLVELMNQFNHHDLAGPGDPKSVLTNTSGQLGQKEPLGETNQPFDLRPIKSPRGHWSHPNPIDHHPSDLCLTSLGLSTLSLTPLSLILSSVLPKLAYFLLSS